MGPPLCMQFAVDGNVVLQCMTYIIQCPTNSCLPVFLFLESWKPTDTEGKKQYDREFLLDFQFMPACIQKPEGLPPISDVVLDKVSCILREN